MSPHCNPSGLLCVLLLDSCTPPLSQNNVPAAPTAGASAQEVELPPPSFESPPAAETSITKTETEDALLTLSQGRLYEFSDFDLELELSIGSITNIAADPDDPKLYPAGVDVSLTMRLNGVGFSLIDSSPGHEDANVAWVHDFKVELVGFNPDTNEAQVRVWKVTGEIREALYRAHKLTVGKRLTLEDGLDLEFLEHSHKRTYPGQRSPLILNFAMMEGSHLVDQQSRNLLPPEMVAWVYRNFAFEMIDYSYDSEMTLNVDALVLQPVIAMD